MGIIMATSIVSPYIITNGLDDMKVYTFMEKQI